MKITKITIGRLYNLGSYEHIRYELTVDVPEGESAATAVLGMERILTALNPSKSTKDKAEIDREKHRLETMRALSDEDFRRQHYGFVGTKEEYLQRIQDGIDEATAKRLQWEARQGQARRLFDHLGGASKFRDAKLDWEDYDGEDC